MKVSAENRDFLEFYHNFGNFTSQVIVLIVSATFCNALAFFTLHSLKNYDIGKKELS